MMRRWLLIMGLAASACSSVEERPKDLLPRDQFTSTLLQAQLIEARLNHEMIIDKRQDMPVHQYYADMFRQQGVTEEDFKRTFRWYTEHPEELKSVYEEILVELQKRADQPAQAPAQ